tara:strand:- start:147 stop:758 length:612 start_codon:yes stop_codon:yes gene_type:complete
MNNLIQKIEKDTISNLTLNKRIPAFRSGDTLKVTVKIIEGERSRLQAFEGVCISRKNNGLNSNFTVRKISHGEGVEKGFPLFSPIIDKIEVIRKGQVKRSKLYYLRSRTGKKARIADSDRGEEKDQYELTESPELKKEEIKNITASKEEIEKSDLSNSNNKESKKELSSETDKKEVEEAKESVEQKSESAASKAEKTLDEKNK